MESEDMLWQVALACYLETIEGCQLCKKRPWDAVEVRPEETTDIASYQKSEKTRYGDMKNAHDCQKQYGYWLEGVDCVEALGLPSTFSLSETSIRQPGFSSVSM
jgi:hypothetical protein